MHIATLLCSVIVACLVTCAHSWNLGCTGDSSFVSSTRTCTTCPEGTAFDEATEQCQCTGTSFKRFLMPDPTNVVAFPFECVDCATRRSVPSVSDDENVMVCLPCSGETPSVTLPPVQQSSADNSTNSTATPSFNITHSYWSEAESTCTCASGSSPASRFGNTSFTAVVCVSCVNCTGLCPSTLVYSAATKKCVCPTGYDTLQTDHGPRCVARSSVTSIESAAGNDRQVSGPNVRNSGTATRAVPSYVTDTLYRDALVGCIAGNSTACNAIANLCVLANYELTKAACALYRQLQLRESCRGVGCEIPTTVPWLYYLRSSADILRFTGIKLQVALRPANGFVDRLRLVIASYAVNGTFLGHTAVTDQLTLCDIPASGARQFFTFGARREVGCSLNLRWYFAAPETVIHELFLEDVDGALIDVPVLQLWDQTVADFVPRDIDDGTLFRPSSSDPSQGGYKRRFYLYDNVASRATADGTPKFVTR
jgi:meckelin